MTVSQIDRFTNIKKLTSSSRTKQRKIRRTSRKTSRKTSKKDTISCLYCNQPIERKTNYCIACGKLIQPEELDVATITLPEGHYKKESIVEHDGNSIYSVNCIGKKEKDWNYTVLSVFNKIFTSNEKGELIVTGFFKIEDTFTSSLQKGRRYLRIYVLEPEKDTVMQSEEVLDHKDKLHWHYRKLVLEKLKPFTAYKIAIGRRQAWQHNWHIQYEFSDVRITSYDKN